MSVFEDKQRINKNYQLATQNKNVDSRARKCEKSMSQLFTAKSSSRKFKDLSRIFCAKLSEDWFIFNSPHTPWNLQFL